MTFTAIDAANRYRNPAAMSAHLATITTVAARYRYVICALDIAIAPYGRFGLTIEDTVEVIPHLRNILADLTDLIRPAAIAFCALHEAHGAMDTAWELAVDATALGFAYGDSREMMLIAAG